ncbi:MIP family channel protein [Anatilimnocola sp. NA78]|uniref:MIP family channel protein n=1 Tax=Anatilimnocola sp. NA78 TaxID=3415683 RepID=UPI003CE4DDED
MNKAVAEIIGTFALVFAGTGAIVSNEVSGGTVTHVGIALTFGLVVMAMIYALGETSGAHLNPAVTFGFWISKRLPTRDLPLYLVSQLTGALLASACLRVLFWSHPTLGATLPAGSHLQSFFLETILTALLMLVILCVASGSKEKGVMAGIAVGGVVALEAMFAGPISGASMNPARSLAPALLTGRFAEIWIYIAGPLLGAAVAVAIFPWLQAGAPNTDSTQQ